MQDGGQAAHGSLHAQANSSLQGCGAIGRLHVQAGLPGCPPGYFRHGLSLKPHVHLRMPVSQVTPQSHLFMTSCSFLLPLVSKAMSAKVKMPRRRLPSPPDDVMQTLQVPLCSCKVRKVDWRSSWRHALVLDCISAGNAARATVLSAQKDCLPMLH